MTHKLSLNSLVLDYKRAVEGKGVEGTRALTAIVAFALAYNAPLPDNGPYGSGDAVNGCLKPIINNLVSDVNELYCIDMGSVDDMITVMYCNRYDAAHGGRRALEAYSVKQIVDETLGGDIWPTVMLWCDRFVDCVRFYLSETKKG
ncbi:hypothetical protein BIZ83_gp229 [Erwinia phage vB_EamM_ChrisDB]|jgi:hypothetical protein|uniref:hypothetical protein n=1 Tax=Erwinia phage vB_EamM_ChrisDB TaxID=1883371 RepID=UPI00081CA3FC|nr:hypothetical protein BIZ83_gp229 [Erwinia phage vB_EamM_ChrisDB]ANZ48624.1 hypothetical protein CHRISDB_62 [Erwinia phage vB_EamM_ChrisDB]